MHHLVGWLCVHLGDIFQANYIKSCMCAQSRHMQNKVFIKGGRLELHLVLGHLCLFPGREFHSRLDFSAQDWHLACLQGVG